MNLVYRAVVLAVLVTTVTGCAMMEREQLEEERQALQSANDANWVSLERHAPVGSRWASHRDTEAFLSDVRSNNARIREIDARLTR